MDVIKIDPRTYGILPNSGNDLSLNFQAFLKDIAKKRGPKYLELEEKGIYDIYFNNAERQLYYITNTVSEKEVKTPIHTIGLLLKDIEDFEIDGKGATIVFHGHMTNMVIDNCSKITIRNLNFDHSRPTLSQVEVLNKGFLSAQLKISAESRYLIDNGKLYFYGDNWKDIAKPNISRFCTMVVSPNEKDRIKRTFRHPFMFARKVTELCKGQVNVHYFMQPKINKGETFVFGKATRSEVGVFINRSNEISFDCFKQFYNHSHGVVAQCSKNLHFDYVEFAPKKNTERIVSSQSDFMHFNMCSGLIRVSKSYFLGANDDCINVHGVYFKIIEKKEDEIIVRFKHPQAYGFNPFDIGDKIAFVGSNDLLDKSEAMVVVSEQLNNYDIKLILDNRIDNKIKIGDLVENISKCADLLFENNMVSFLTTRGVLVTTRGKVDILENIFKKTSMSGVFINGDGNSWYESGAVKDINIESNKFIECLDNAIFVKPENRINNGAVHQNINIENNKIVVANGNRAITMKSAHNVCIKENTFEGDTKNEPIMKFENCTDVSLKQNELEQNYAIKK